MAAGDEQARRRADVFAEHGERTRRGDRKPATRCASCVPAVYDSEDRRVPCLSSACRRLRPRCRAHVRSGRPSQFPTQGLFGGGTGGLANYALIDPDGVEHPVGSRKTTFTVPRGWTVTMQTCGGAVSAQPANGSQGGCRWSGRSRSSGRARLQVAIGRREPRSRPRGTGNCGGNTVPTKSSSSWASTIGGTFTDAIVLDEATGEYPDRKAPTTPSDWLSVGFPQITTRSLAAAGQVPEDIKPGPRHDGGHEFASSREDGACGLPLTTEGFRDILEDRGRSSRSRSTSSSRNPALVPPPSLPGGGRTAGRRRPCGPNAGGGPVAGRGEDVPPGRRRTRRGLLPPLLPQPPPRAARRGSWAASCPACRSSCPPRCPRPSANTSARARRW